ncbi:MAG: NAD(P)-dependent oxidoreductase [Planctomycetia bacterium]|nr:NAD(P)-dependent oxidoreductase [Planctomycetia bacterium]
MNLPKIGWIGTGIMGTAMCRRLMEAGYSCTVYSRTQVKAYSLLDCGACWAETPAEVARQSDIIFTMVGYPTDVEQVILAPENGVLAGCRTENSTEITENNSPRKIIVDMTTSRPSLAEKIASCAAKKGVSALDAPVSGGDIGAKNGTLSIMVGGYRETFDALCPIWEILGKTIHYQGGPGMGQHTKMMNQILIAGTMLGMCEALRYAQCVGLDVPHALKSVSTGAAGSWSLTNLAPRVLRDDFAPGFKITHFVKDLRIALDEAYARNLQIPGVELAERLYSELQDAGLADAGTQALVQWPKKGE